MSSEVHDTSAMLTIKADIVSPVFMLLNLNFHKACDFFTIFAGE